MRGDRSTKIWSIKDRNLQSLLVAMMKLLLQTSHRTRPTMGSTADTFALPAGRQVVDRISSELETYEARVGELHKKDEQEAKEALRQLGPPTGGRAVAQLE